MARLSTTALCGNMHFVSARVSENGCSFFPLFCPLPEKNREKNGENTKNSEESFFCVGFVPLLRSKRRVVEHMPMHYMQQFRVSRPRIIQPPNLLKRIC